MRPMSPRNLNFLLHSPSSSLLSAPPFFLQVSHLSSSSAQHFHSQSSFRRLDEDVRKVRVSVWWDFENCHLPYGVNVNVFKVAHTITAALRANGIKGPIQITAFGDMLQLSRANQEALSSTGIILTHVPRGGKNSADRSLLADLMYWVSQNPPPAHLFLISGDRDFASILHRLRMNNYNILLAGPPNTPGVLCSAASIMWPWHALLAGENLTGKYFNQPPDGPHGSWYGHYKVPLEDPFIEQPEFSETEKLSDPYSDSKLGMIPPGSDSNPRPIPKAVMKQISKLLNSHPKGISISDLRMELRNSNIYLEKELYGYKKFTRFLLAMPHILRLQPLGEGKFMIHGVTTKSPEPFECSQGMSTGPVSDNGNQELNLGSQLDCDERSTDGRVNRKLSLPTSTEPSAEEPYRELQQPFSLHSSLTKDSDGKSLPLPFPENMKPSAPQDEKSPSPSPENLNHSAPIDEKVEVAKAQETEFHLPRAVAQDFAPEVGYFKRVWRKWFGSRDNASGTRSLNDQEESCTSGNGIEKEGRNTLEKYFTYDDNPGKGKKKEKFVKSTGEVVDPPPASSSSHNESAEDNKTATILEVANESKTSPGLFDQIVNLRKFWRTSPSSDKLSDQSHDKLKLMNTHCQKHMLFSNNSFWSDMESFMDTPKALVLVSKSRTRKQMALNLKKEGPLWLRSHETSDLLHLVDLLISEKKWVEECPSKKSPFKLTHCNEKSAFDHSQGSNGLRSIFLGKPSQHDMQRSPEHGEKNCQNIPHTGVALPMINKIESSHAIPPCTAPNMFDVQKDTLSNTVVSSDNELSDVSRKNDDSDSPWEELGPIASTTSNKNEVEIASRRKATESTNFSYEPLSLSDDFSDSDGETLPTTGSEGRVKDKVNNEPSSLLQILDSWYTNKDGDSSKDKSDNFDGFVDSANVSKLSGSSGVGIKSGTSLGNNARTQRPRKSYSFVADSVGDDKDKLIDGILSSLEKKSERTMES